MTSDPTRADPLIGDLDLSDFKPTPRKATARREEIRQASEANNFPSRSPEPTKRPQVPQRRRRTGRNVQFNIKATAETIARFTALADKRNVPFGELLEQLLDAIESESKRGF